MKIKSEEQGIRLDAFVSKYTPYSRSKIMKMITSHYLFVNGQETKASYKVKIGDEVEILDGYHKKSKVPAIEMPLDIIYEDDVLLVLNKPKGLAIHPAGKETISLFNGLIAYFLGNKSVTPGLVHRLDKDTSGLLVVAKNEEAHAFLAQHIIEKKYICLLQGHLINDMEVTVPIGQSSVDSRMSVTGINPKCAHTHFKILKYLSNNTLVECTLYTGRKHQIRVHALSLGHPIIEDRLYNQGTLGQFLCAYKLKFIHPISHEEMSFELPIPNDFLNYK